MSVKSLISACALAALAVAPVAGSATSMSSPKPMMGMKSTHQCRDAKGHFVKGKYMKCPAGTHKAM